MIQRIATCKIWSAGVALNVALIGPSPVVTFYLPFTRAWELLAGGALAGALGRISQDEQLAFRPGRGADRAVGGDP